MGFDPGYKRDEIMTRSLLRNSIHREIIRVYALVCAGVFLATRARSVPWLAEYVPVVVAAIFLWTATHLAQRDVGGLDRYGIGLGGLIGPGHDEGSPGPLGMLELTRTLWAAVPMALREIGMAFIVIALVFPMFAVLFYLFHRPEHPFHWSPPEHLLSLTFSQLVIVALPEEAFFRGYLQTRLVDAGAHAAEVSKKAKQRLRSAVPILVQAAYFGFIHVLVDLDPLRFSVFFPGLLFGVMRAERKGIGAAIVVHAASNLYSEILVRGWLV